jgi:hypothetical protein
MERLPLPVRSSPGFLVNRILMPYLLEAMKLLDAGVIFGTGFALFRGSPIHAIHSGGLANQRDQLELLKKRHGKQFHPDEGWSKLRGMSCY